MKHLYLKVFRHTDSISKLKPSVSKLKPSVSESKPARPEAGRAAKGHQTTKEGKQYFTNYFTNYFTHYFTSYFTNYLSSGIENARPLDKWPTVQ